MITGTSPTGLVTASSHPAQAPGVPWVTNVKDGSYGAKGDGVTNDTAAIQAAISAVTSSGVVYLPPGNYVLGSALTINNPGVWLSGAGSAVTKLSPSFVGDAVRVQMSAFVTTQAGKLGGFTIDGTSAGAGACGLHYGDVVGGHLDDLVVQNFTGAGSKGIWIDNRTNWTERILWTRVHANGNTTGVLFDVNGGTTSWGYHRILDLRVNANSGQTGVIMQAGGQLYNGVFNLMGNLASGGTLLSLVGNAFLGPSLISILAELTGGGSATGLAIASGSSITGSGSVDVSTGGITSTNAGTIQFTGWFNIPSLGAGGRIAVNGTGLGFFGHGPMAQPSAYTLNAGAVSRNLASGATLTNVEQVLRELITDLQAYGLMQ